MRRLKSALSVFFIGAGLWMFITSVSIITGHTVKPSPRPYTHALVTACVGIIMFYGRAQVSRIRVGPRARTRPEPLSRGYKAFQWVAVVTVTFLSLQAILSAEPMLIIGAMFLAIPVYGELFWRLVLRKTI